MYKHFVERGALSASERTENQGPEKEQHAYEYEQSSSEFFCDECRYGALKDVRRR